MRFHITEPDVDGVCRILPLYHTERLEATGSFIRRQRNGLFNGAFCLRDRHGKHHVKVIKGLTLEQVKAFIQETIGD